MESGFRENLLRVMARSDLRSETIALAADVVSVDARFNATIAEKKRKDEDVDIFALADMYEGWLDECVGALNRFEASPDEGVLADALRGARDSLRQKLVELGGVPA